MRIIALLLLCIGLVSAKEIPGGTKPQSKTALEFRAAVVKWRAKLVQFKTPESRKSQEYLSLKRQMQKELHELRFGRIDASGPELKVVPKNFGNESGGGRLSARLSDFKSMAGSSAGAPQPLYPVTVIRDTTTYEIPFASKGNTIEIAVVNTSNVGAQEVTVELKNSPGWLKFSGNSASFAALKSNEEKLATFDFSVDKTAELNKVQTLSFSITDKSGHKWTNEIAIKVSPPATYDLSQNYPNPFNPTTTIEYQLPGTGSPFNISLKVYDILGREVATLAGERQEAGFYQKIFDARRFASGMYVYRLVATGSQNKRHVFQKKMLMVK